MRRLNKATKDLDAAEKDLNKQRACFESSSFAISHAFKKIKSSYRGCNTAESRKIQDLINKLEIAMSNNYKTAVQKAYEGNPKDDQKEKDIADIYNMGEKLTYVDHQLKISRKTLSKLMSWKERLEYHETLK